MAPLIAQVDGEVHDPLVTTNLVQPVVLDRALP